MRWNDPHTRGLDRISPSASLDEIQSALVRRGWHFSSKLLLIIDEIEVVLGDRWDWYPDRRYPIFFHEFWDEAAECWCRQTICWYNGTEVCQVVFALCIKSLIYHSTAGIGHTTTSLQSLEKLQLRWRQPLQVEFPHLVARNAIRQPSQR